MLWKAVVILEMTPLNIREESLPLSVVTSTVTLKGCPPAQCDALDFCFIHAFQMSLGMSALLQGFVCCHFAAQEWYLPQNPYHFL